MTNYVRELSPAHYTLFMNGGLDWYTFPVISDKQRANGTFDEEESKLSNQLKDIKRGDTLEFRCVPSDIESLPDRAKEDYKDVIIGTVIRIVTRYGEEGTNQLLRLDVSRKKE